MPTILKSEQSRASTSFRFDNAEQKRMHAWANAEVADMIDYARPAREIGSDSIRGYMGVVHKSRNHKKDRSDIVFPLMHATIYSRMVIEAARAPQMKMTAQHESDEPNIRWVDSAIKGALSGGPHKPPYDHVYFEQTFDKNLLGVGAVYAGYEFNTRVGHVKDDNGKWIEKTMIIDDDIRVRNIDFFNFGVSRDTKPGMYDGSRCYMDTFYDRSAFFSRFGNHPFYNHVNDNMIPNGDWYMGSGTDAGSYAKPRMWKDIYRVRYLWDIVNDLFYVQANGIPIRWDHILEYGNREDPVKMLPIFTTHNDVAFEYDRQSATSQFAVQNNRFYTESSQVNTNKSFWSKPESLIVKPMIATQNTFGRAMVDWLKASSVHFVMGPTGVIDRINKGKLYGIEPIKLDAGDFNTKSLVSGSTFLGDFKVASEYLQSMSHAALGRDIFRVASQTPPQATVAAMQRELEQRRDAQNNRFNSTGGILRMYWYLYNLVQQFYVQPREIKITDLGQIEDVDEYRILRDANGSPVFRLDPKEIDIDFPVVEISKTKTMKVKNPVTGEEILRSEKRYTLVSPNHSEAKKQKKRGSNSFFARADYMQMRKRPRMTIIPLSTFQEDNAIQKAASVEVLNAIAPYVTMQVDGKPAIPKEALIYILGNFVKAQGGDWDLDKFMSLVGGKQEAGAEEAENIPPPFADASDMEPAMGGMGGSLPAGMGSGVPTQTSKQGSPPAPGGALNTNAALAASLSM